jgi:hypothetical protein
MKSCRREGGRYRRFLCERFGEEERKKRRKKAWEKEEEPGGRSPKRDFARWAVLGAGGLGLGCEEAQPQNSIQAGRRVHRSWLANLCHVLPIRYRVERREADSSALWCDWQWGVWVPMIAWVVLGARPVLGRTYGNRMERMRLFGTKRAKCQ